MNKIRVIPIFNQVDVHAARMYTREAARQIGMELIDQARVSLATSSLAECLKMIPPHASRGMEADRGGSQITIEFLDGNPHSGIRVSFSCPFLGENSCIHQQVEKVRSLVDQITMEQSQENMIQIVLVKWGSAAEAVETRLSHEITG